MRAIYLLIFVITPPTYLTLFIKSGQKRLPCQQYLQKKVRISRAMCINIIDTIHYLQLCTLHINNI